MSFSRSVVFYLVFTLVVGCIAQALAYSFPEGTVLVDKFWVIFGFMAGITFIAFLFAYLGIRKGKEVSVFGIMGATVVKLIFCMAFVLVYVLNTNVNDVLFVSNFFSLYLLFTAFEIYCLLRNLRHQNFK